MKTNSTDTLAKLDSFTRAYIECALWTDEERLKEDADQHEDEYQGAEKWDVNIYCLAPKALEEIIGDCQDFQTANEALLSQAYEREDYGSEQAGHDFWLTRNGHGAGFWDRGLFQVGRGLTNASKPYGSQDLYFGDDGLIYA